MIPPRLPKRDHPLPVRQLEPCRVDALTPPRRSSPPNRDPRAQRKGVRRTG
jgi:hypothetical protein